MMMFESRPFVRSAEETSYYTSGTAIGSVESDWHDFTHSRGISKQLSSKRSAIEQTRNLVERSWLHFTKCLAK
jgi:hypothetical protein